MSYYTEKVSIINETIERYKQEALDFQKAIEFLLADDHKFGDFRYDNWTELMETYIADYLLYLDECKMTGEIPKTLEEYIQEREQKKQLTCEGDIPDKKFLPDINDLIKETLHKICNLAATPYHNKEELHRLIDELDKLQRKSLEEYKEYIRKLSTKTLVSPALDSELEDTEDYSY